jgi:hypothetical protein
VVDSLIVLPWREYGPGYWILERHSAGQNWVAIVKHLPTDAWAGLVIAGPWHSWKPGLIPLSKQYSTREETQAAAELALSDNYKVRFISIKLANLI